MKKYILPLLLILLFFSCKKQVQTEIPKWISYDETNELIQNANHEKKRMRYKLIQSKILDKNEIWKKAAHQIAYFSEEDYEKLKPYILEQDISTIQSKIQSHISKNIKKIYNRCKTCSNVLIIKNQYTYHAYDNIYCKGCWEQEKIKIEV